MPRKKAIQQLIAVPKRVSNHKDKPDRPPGEVPLRTRNYAGWSYAYGRWYQLQEAGIVPNAMREPVDRTCNYAFQNVKGCQVEVRPYAKYMWDVCWPEESASVEQKPAEPPPTGALVSGEKFNGMPTPGRKMIWFKDRSNWTPEKHIADLEEKIAKCEAQDDDPGYWQKQLREYRASLR